MKKTAKAVVIICAATAVMAVFLVLLLKRNSSNFSENASVENTKQAKSELQVAGPKEAVDEGRQSQINAFWATAHLGATPLQKVIDDALVSRDPEGRARALRYTDACVSIQASSRITEEDLKKSTTASSVDLQALIREQKIARAQLTDFCATGRASSLVDELKNRHLPMMGPVEKAIVLEKSGPHTQEYFQAVTEVLASPNTYPVQFDIWMKKDLSSQLEQRFDMNESQSLFIQDQIYKDFVADDFHGVRLLERCAIYAACPSNNIITDAERIKAQQIVDQLEVLIKQQQWNQLIRNDQ